MTSLTEALAPRSDQLNADDLIPGPRTIKITGAKIARDGRQLRITLNYEGDNGKPFKPCKTMGRAMVMVWGITDDNFEEQFRGKAIRVYRDPDVKFGDQGAVGGIRISHMSHIDKAARVKLTVSQGKKAEFVFQPLPSAVPQKDAQREWATDFAAKCNAAADSDALESLIAKQQKWIDILKDERPELHAECQHAIDMKRGSFDADAHREGRIDEQHGEQFSDGEDFGGEA